MGASPPACVSSQESQFSSDGGGAAFFSAGALATHGLKASQEALQDALSAAATLNPLRRRILEAGGGAGSRGGFGAADHR